TLGVIGLGQVGLLIANDAENLGMDVIGYDPYISVDAAWDINRSVTKASSIDEVLQKADYITIHVPFLDSTRNMIDSTAIRQMKASADRKSTRLNSSHVSISYAVSCLQKKIT